MSQLPDTVWSPDDLAELIADLQRYNQWLASYQVKQRVAAGSQPTTPPEMTPAAIACLHDLHAKQALNSAGVESLIAALKGVQDAAPRVSFTLAAPASMGLKKSLVAWCRNSVNPDVLISFQFNATILGGMVVRYGSHIFDWSFRRQILDNRSRFAEILRHV